MHEFHAMDYEFYICVYNVTYEHVFLSTIMVIV